MAFTAPVSTNGLTHELSVTDEHKSTGIVSEEQIGRKILRERHRVR
jgi:hypothetical protein